MYMRARFYEKRLIERSFCLDVNVLARGGFFRGGYGPTRLYECITEYDNRRKVFCSLISSQYRDELAINVQSPECDFPEQIIRAIECDHRLTRLRFWFLCSNCRKKVAMLFIPPEKSKLGCRRCHKLVYWSQMRGKRRTGLEEYERWKEVYKVHKHLTICNENIQK